MDTMRGSRLLAGGDFAAARLVIRLIGSLVLSMR